MSTGGGAVSFLGLAVSAYLVMVGALYFAQRSLMYHPAALSVAPVDLGLPQFGPESFTTEDGLRLLSWYAKAEAGRPTLVYFHGNAGSIAGRAEKVRPLLDAGYGVLLVGYRGYGGNPGDPSEAGLYADGRAALTFLNQQGVSDLVLYGESLGTGVATKMAVEKAEAGQPVAAVILEAPYTSMGDAAQDRYFYVPAKWLVRDRYDNLQRVPRIGSPLLIVHGSLDRTVGVTHGQAVHQAALHPKTWKEFPGAAHNDLYDHGAAEVVLSFLGDLKRGEGRGQ
ncbi:alpha/beta hydrolase [Magnetospira sp. QH-2]|uniref:alpha/beta hydrolase n=1 Tax=Magnetospira sp. (strain QH-2) TaxID=1288970 RepID=UPI0003E81036|nr:alpha/beta hydrolase [Magnetospira sp. QH-2]CCQ73530.1 Conserved protein of unknown function [Magnetospira sp. QH-2]